ncbi:hypothetical protein QYF36_023303 [Acer negundo]|nr:hypothetical protein QYF36_023303 [Acer negundo]
MEVEEKSGGFYRYNDNTRSRQNFFFTEVLKGNLKRNDERMEESKSTSKTLLMGCNLSDDKWLENCAVRVLKEFSNVSKVNNRLVIRGFSCLASYLGGRFVLWSFELVYECKSFIRMCPTEVKFVDGNRSFSIIVEEEMSLVDFEWLVEYMGLKMELPSSVKKDLPNMGFQSEDG